MESSRDSSVWRSLAVTFGGGLALGAVGMKLTQSALRPLEIPLRPDSNPVDDRLDRMERRLERIEHTSAASPAPAAAATDQKVLEAVVGAVDVRLQEHTALVERRLADLEARIAAEFETLAAAQGELRSTRSTLAETRQQFHQEVAALRAAVGEEVRQIGQTVSQTVAGQAAAQAEIQALRQRDDHILDATEQRVADMRRQLRQELAEYRTGIEDELGRFGDSVSQSVAEQMNTHAAALEQSIETRIVTSAAAATAARFEEQLAPLRAEVEHKERELSDLRKRLTESERAVLDVILAIGQVCREAAERIGGGGVGAPAPVATAPRGQPAWEELAHEVPAATAPEVDGIVPEPASLEAVAPAEPQAEEQPTVDQALPDFLQSRIRSRPWRIPLVSSFLVTTGCLLLLHYL